MIRNTETTEVALDEYGGHIMLSLKCGKDKFCQALSAGDMGKLFLVMRLVTYEAVCCEGDLTIHFKDGVGLELIWNVEGNDCKVVLDTPSQMVFGEACKSYCRQLMRSNKGE